jgi:hydrogenase/urease accessory protein HupE
VLAVIAVPSPAEAHLVTTGIGPFFDGIVHSLISIESALAIAGIGILAGQSGKAAARAVVIVAPPAWLAGAVLSMQAGVVPLQPWLSVACFLGLGLAIAARLQLSPMLMAIVALLAAVALGCAASADLMALPSAALFLLGNVAAIAVAVILIAGLALSLSAGWTLVALRVMGSWLAAAGLLLLGWTLRSQSWIT